MASQIRSAIRTSVVNIHAFVYTTGNQTTSQPASERRRKVKIKNRKRREFDGKLPHHCDDESGNVSDDAWLSSDGGIDLRMAAGTNHVSRVRSDRDDCGHDVCGGRMWRHVRTRGRDAANGLSVARRRGLRRHESIRRGCSVLTHPSNYYQLQEIDGGIIESFLGRPCGYRHFHISCRKS